MRQTTIVNTQQASKKWYVIDAQGQVLGRLAAFVASVLRGKINQHLHQMLIWVIM